MRKIMFSDAYQLTQAVLDGRKTQTRRIVPRSFFTCTHDILDNNTLVCEDEYGDWHDIRETRYALQIGEVVAVAQSYKDIVEHLAKKSWDIARWLDKHGVTKNMAGWFNKMFVKAGLMIHYIRITDVRVERLQDISYEDCMAEGVYIHDEDPMNPQAYLYSFPNSPNVYYHPREAYAALIDNISGKGTWESNSYVFAYTFELMK